MYQLSNTGRWKIRIRRINGDIDAKENMIMVLLLCMSMDVFNYLFYWIYLALIACIIVYSKGFKLPYMLIAPLVLSVSLCIFSPLTTADPLSLLKHFSYPVCLFMGYNIASAKDEETCEKRVNRIIICTAGGAFTHYVLNIMFNWGAMLQRSQLNIWTGETLASTGHAALACMMLGVAVAKLLIANSKKQRFLMMGILTIIVAYNLVLACRTTYVLLIAALLAGILCLSAVMKNTTRKRKIYIRIATILLLLFLAVCFNVFDIQSSVQESVFWNRFFSEQAVVDINEDGRIDLKIRYMEKMLDHLWGGLYIRTEVGNYAHDIFLDTYDESGIFAFLAVVVIVLDFIIKSLRILRRKTVSVEMKMVIACTVTVILLECMIEPILSGIQWFFACFCLIYGAIGKLYKQSR